MARLNADFKFRCSKRDKARFLRIAAKHRREQSDHGRIVLEDYCNEQERLLGLNPITDEEVEAFITASYSRDFPPQSTRPVESKPQSPSRRPIAEVTPKLQEAVAVVMKAKARPSKRLK